MSTFLNSTQGKTSKAFVRTLVATAFMAVVLGGIGTARAVPVPTFPTLATTVSLFPGFSYLDVPTHLANSESLGIGFDIQLGAFVGDFATYGGLAGSGQFAAFRFWNPTQAQGGSESSLSGAQARIHEIYFEDALRNYLNIGAPVLVSNGTYYDGLNLSPSDPSGIIPSWAGTFAGLDQGGGPTFGVGEGESFEILFALFGPATTTSSLIDNVLGSSAVNARIAMHIGDCDGRNSCVIDTWPPTVIPLPAALPLYGTGLALISFVGWRKKRKASQA